MSLRYRFAKVDATDDGIVRCVASSDEPVEMPGFREILSHADGAVDVDAARSVLFNHDRNQPIGKIRSCRVDGGKRLCAELEISKDARAASGVALLELVRSGAIEGVSVGYEYAEEDAEYDQQARTVTVKRWKLREISLTPTQADVTAKITQRGLPPAFKEARKDPIMADTIKPEDAAAQIKAATERACIAEMRLDLSDKARAAGVECDFSGVTTLEEGMSRIIDNMRSKIPAPAAPVNKSPSVIVTADAQEKFRSRCHDSLLQRGGIDLKGKRVSDPIGIREMARRCAKIDGVEDFDDWSDSEQNSWISRQARYFGKRDAANKVAGSFAGILANAAEVALADGFDSYLDVTWPTWCSVGELPDFKQATIAGLASGFMAETPENVAFPELTQKDASYNSTLGMWGATVSLTAQMIANDSLGEFMRSLRMAGEIYAGTVEKEVFKVLLNATWTSDTVTSGSISSSVNLDRARKALLGKLSPSGEKMGLSPRFLICDPSQTSYAQQATGQIYSGGQTFAPSTQSRAIQVIESVYVSDTNLLSGALYTDWYLVAARTDRVRVNFWRGQRGPMIVPFDAGAVAAEKWKIMGAFDAVVATHTDSAAASRVSGIVKATA
jgi:HK97 family phage prohead protease